MQNPEELAQEALNYLDLAQKLEEEKDIVNAISNYQKAADILKQSGFLMHRIQEIYDRIGELKDFLRQETFFQQIQTKAQIEQSQDRAFNLLEGAKKLEFDGFIEDAIQQYLSAIELLIQAGWSETQLSEIKTKIKKLSLNLQKRESIQESQQKIPELQKSVTQIIQEEKPQAVDMFGQKSSIEKAEVIRKFRAKRKHENDVQNQAFEHIDTAKMFEKEKKFDYAILNYEKAMELLTSIGWSNQIKNIQALIDKLKKDKIEFESLQTQESDILKTSDIQKQKISLEKEAELQKERLNEFESKKKFEEQIQLKAFNLIDIGNRLEREKNYTEAIERFEQAIELLRSIEWDSYVQPIVSLVNQIKEKQKSKEIAENLKEKRQRKLSILQDSISKKQKEGTLKSEKEFVRKRTEYEEKRKDAEKKEEDLFKLLDNADKILREKDFEGALKEYQKALSFISNLGAGWEAYTSMIRNTITMVEKLKYSHLTKKIEDQKKLELKEKEEIEIQKQIANYLDKERDRLKKKEIVIVDHEEQVKSFGHRKNIAFEFLDSALEFLRKGDYENSILAYQNAANIFAEIQWIDEIPLIEDSIREVEELQRTHNILKQKKLKDTIERQKKEEKFQKEILKYMEQEREKLKNKEIVIKQREEQARYKEERRKIGFKLLDEAQDKLKQGDFDESIEILKYAINFFADMDWQNEITLIQNAIIEIENKKREVELDNQIKLQTELEREKQEREFQEYITKELKLQKDELRQEQIILREREKELSFRERKKNEVFDLLEKAQDFLSFGKFDEVLEIYYNVVNLFAQIQWNEEIPIIQEAIENIENRKSEMELNKQKLMEISIKREVSDKAFIERIKYYRERKKDEILKQKIHIEKQKQLSAQNLTKQNKAFSLIEESDGLIKKKNFSKARDNYSKAIELLKNIGWENPYLTLLNDTIQFIEARKKEYEKERQKEFEISLKRKQEEEEFQKAIQDYMIKQQNKLKTKAIEIRHKEDLLQKKENQKLEAFKLMDNADLLLNKGEYDEAFKGYYKAELLLNEINFPTGAIREMIHKIQKKKREEEINKMKEVELNLRFEQEERLFQQQILERINLEQQQMKEKQEKLFEQEKLSAIREQKKQEAFDILEESQKLIKQGKFDDALDFYNKAMIIFKEIEWNEQVVLIENAITTVENKKKEAILQKQRDLDASIAQEKLEKAFREDLVREMREQREKLKKSRISLREKEKELAFREKRKEEAFSLLDKAQEYLSKGRFEDVLELYHNVANIFAQIQWTEEVPLINNAIRDIENQKKEKDLLKQKAIQDAIEKERSEYEFMEKIKILKEKEEVKALEQKDLMQKREMVTSQYSVNQEEAFKLIINGYNLLNKKNYDGALKNYQDAINILTEIGWTSDYLILLQNTIKTIEVRRREMEREKELEIELLNQQQKEEEKFQKRILESLNREQERLKVKEIEIKKREKLQQIMEESKQEAFEIMDKAEIFFDQRQYIQAIENYRQAELLLNQIGFPTNAIREMIQKIQDQNQEELFKKQKDLEFRLQKEQEDIKFQKKIEESIKINEIKLREKQIVFQQQKRNKEYIEKRKEEAFNLLDEAKIFMNQSQYDKSLEYYHTAELILNEIAFPTDSIREVILRVQKKKQEYHLQKQKELEKSIKREREDWEYQQKMAEKLRKEKDRLKIKELEVLKEEQLKQRLEERKEQAFKILDEGERFFKDKNYDNALVCYRKAGIILNELQFPTSSINNMIQKIIILKKEKEDVEHLEYQKELEKLEEERELEALIEERKRQERDKRKAQKLALQEREKIIHEQMSVRESAYSLLEEAGKYLKRHIPNYNEAISLYIQARHILAENIGWEPEINNLNALIKDLQQEQANFLERKRLEEEARIRHENEYALFQEELRRRRLEQEILKREQEKQYRDLIYKRKHLEQIKDEGLKLIDEGKKQTKYHEFEKAYTNFEAAISKFKEIGWNKEIKYIETEIKNAKLLDERVKNEEERIRSIQDQLERQRILEEKRKKDEEVKLKETVGEVGELADDVIVLIEKRRQDQKLAAKQKEEKVKYEAKEFRKEMGSLMKMKQELIDEIAKKEAEKKEFQEKLQKAKKREEIDNLKRMIKETSKKK